MIEEYVYRHPDGSIERSNDPIEGVELVRVLSGGVEIDQHKLGVKRSNVDVMDVFNVNWRLI